MLVLLILLDFFWSAAAWIYDAPKLANIPPYFWPFVAVCPIYPLLIALNLLQLYRKKEPNQFLLGFGAIGGALYGALAILYYPLAMAYQGFLLNALGQIFWVLFYALQGFWLFLNYQIKREVYIFVGAVLVLKLIIIDYFYKSFGYFDFTEISSNLLIGLLSLAVISLGVFYKIRKS